MAKTDDLRMLNAGTSRTADEPGISTPDINPKTLKVRRKAIKDGTQANELGEGLEQGNSERNTTNALIVAQYDGEQPFSDADLTNSVEDWRNNFLRFCSCRRFFVE